MTRSRRVIAGFERRSRAADVVLDRGICSCLRSLGVYGLLQRRHVDHVLADQTLKVAVPYVSVIHAVPMNGQSDLILPGPLQAFVISPIYARTNGYLSKWYKDIGSKVTKGELLAEIETPEIDQQLAQARADLVTAQANLGFRTRLPRVIRTSLRRILCPSRKWTTPSAISPPRKAP